jgi:hypothetical protein
MGKPLYVCVTCSQDFTRGSDARRHNFKHHFKQAKIVGFIEYLIGRTNGTLPPPSQTPPRLSAKNKRKMVNFCKNDKPVMTKDPVYGLEINPSLHNESTSSCCCEDRIRKANVRLYELEQLLLPFANSQYVEELIKSIVRHCNTFGDYDDYVEECFQNHRENIIKKRWHMYPK